MIDSTKYYKLEKENRELKKELQHYKLAVHEISRYINAYYPYFTETQEQNNKKIATIIHELGAGDVIWQ